MNHVPANHHADAPECGVEDADLPPPAKVEHFEKGRMPFPVGQDFAVRAGQHERVEDAVGSPLHNSGPDPASGLPAAALQPARAGTTDRLCKVVEPPIVGVAGGQALGQEDELGALLRCFANEVIRLVQV